MRSYALVRRSVSFLVAFSLSFAAAIAAEDAKPQSSANHGADDGKLRIIVFGAHPDDAEFKAAGSAILWARQGHHVKLVSVTNGDIGHWQIAGGPLAQRRQAEVQAAAKKFGTTSQVLDNHDGELLPTLENRLKIIRLIRDWQADIVIAHRPWDYHPDHRYTGVLIQDAAFMVTVPFICPDTPPLTKNPVFLYSSDGFKKPYPFEADVAVDIGPAFEQKLAGIHELASQVYEGGAIGNAEFVRSVPPASDDAGRRAYLREKWEARQGNEAKRFRAKLIELYGQDRGNDVKFAEAFEICEYGRQPTPAEIKQLFPFFGE